MASNCKSLTLSNGLNFKQCTGMKYFIWRGVLLTTAAMYLSLNPSAETVGEKLLYSKTHECTYRMLPMSYFVVSNVSPVFIPFNMLTKELGSKTVKQIMLRYC